MPLEKIEAEMQPTVPEDLKEKRKSETYHYAQIYENIRELEKEELVRTVKDTSGVRVKRIAELTFTGIIMFLRIFDWKTKMEKSKAKKAIDNYSEIIPFSAKWDEIEKIVGQERALDCLKRTANAFEFLQKIRFEIKKLNLEFQGFLRRPIASLSIPIPGTTSKSDRDTEFTKFLAINDTLMKAYISYLAVQDISFLSYLNREEIEKWIDKIWSEKELAFFEKRPIQQNSLFSGERLREFFPDYATLNYFFTGMFMENLLWRTIEPEKFLYPDWITLDY